MHWSGVIKLTAFFKANCQLINLVLMLYVSSYVRQEEIFTLCLLHFYYAVSYIVLEIKILIYISY